MQLVQELLEALHAQLLGVTEGEVASYIPPLAAAAPDGFGIAVATCDGYVYAVGDVDLPFTIQSVSKPFVYALALADRGLDAVLAKVGVEPTGEPFNSMAVDEATGRARNPMVNAGAIATTGLIEHVDDRSRLERIRHGLSICAGRELQLDEHVWAAERQTGHRNRAIAHMLRTTGALDDDVDGVIDAYFGQCSLLVTARDLAVMAATLAADGVNPVTHQQAVPTEHIGRVLTIMSTCGMYDYAGEWLYRVGLPAKSGVAGGIAAVLPGELGIGLYSPRLDVRGNSVRGIQACRRLSAALELHLLRPAGRPTTASSRSYRGDVARSMRARPEPELAVLTASGAAIVVHELHGEQSFSSADVLSRTVLADLYGVEWVILDFSRCGRVDAPAGHLLCGLLRALARMSITVALADPLTLPAAVELSRGIGSPEGAHGRRLTGLDAALEWCEDGLLAREGALAAVPEALVPLREQELLRALSPEQLAVVESNTTTRVLTPGQVLFEEGDPADAIYFVAAGQVTADILAGRPSRRIRVNRLAAGQAFGELAVLDGATRSSRIVIDEPTLCHVLNTQALQKLRHEHPDIASAIFHALALSLSQRLGQTTRLLRAVQS